MHVCVGMCECVCGRRHESKVRASTPQPRLEGTKEVGNERTDAKRRAGGVVSATTMRLQGGWQRGSRGGRGGERR